MTATLSVAAVQESVIAVWPTALVVSPVGVLGGVVSVQAVVCWLVVAVVEVLVAASTAATPRV